MNNGCVKQPLTKMEAMYMKFYPGFRSFDLFDDFFDDDFGLTASSQLMKTDICEKNGNYELSMEVPGIKKEDIQLELKDGYLKITANRNTNNEEKDKDGRIIRQERFTGSCSRSFYVGENIKEEDIKANFDNGELKITFPSDKPKQVEEKKYIPIE